MNKIKDMFKKRTNNLCRVTPLNFSVDLGTPCIKESDLKWILLTNIFHTQYFVSLVKLFYLKYFPNVYIPTQRLGKKEIPIN